MARKGRKRKAGLRTPSGHLSRSKKAILERSENSTVVAQPHRKWLPAEKRTSQLAENVLGRLRLSKRILEPEYLAGEAFRRMMTDFSQVVASPRVPGSSMGSMVASGMETPADADHLSVAVPETPEQKHERVFSQFDSAMIVVRNCERSRAAEEGISMDRKLFTILDEVVMQDILPDVQGLAKLRFALKSLASFWHLSEEERPIKGIVNERARWEHNERQLLIERKALA